MIIKKFNAVPIKNLFWKRLEGFIKFFPIFTILLLICTCVNKPPRESVGGLAIDCGGNYLFVGRFNGNVEQWDIGNRKFIKNFNGFNGTVLDIVLDHSCKRLFAGGSADTVEWNILSGNIVGEYEKGIGTISSLAIDNEDRFIFTGSFGTGIVKWDTNNHKYLKSYSQTGNIYSLIVDSKHQNLILAKEGDIVSIPLYEGKASSVKIENFRVNCLAVSPDFKYVFSGGDEKKVKQWELPQVSFVKIIVEHNDDVSALAISPDGNFIVSGDSSGNVFYHDLITGGTVWKKQTPLKWIGNLIISSNKYVIVSGYGKEILILEQKTGNILGKIF